MEESPKKKILIVDDDALNIKLMQKRLEDKGYEVIIARDGDVGLEKAQKQNPDLIILDVEMPRMNGYFFISELRKEEHLANLPVIIITSHEEMESAFGNKGISNYLIKPIDFEKLFIELETILKKED